VSWPTPNGIPAPPKSIWIKRSCTFVHQAMRVKLFGATSDPEIIESSNLAKDYDAIKRRNARGEGPCRGRHRTESQPLRRASGSSVPARSFIKRCGQSPALARRTAAAAAAEKRQALDSSEGSPATASASSLHTKDVQRIRDCKVWQETKRKGWLYTERTKGQLTSRKKDCYAKDRR
jgi:hypothetical protein